MLNGVGSRLKFANNCIFPLGFILCVPWSTYVLIVRTGGGCYSTLPSLVDIGLTI